MKTMILIVEIPTTKHADIDGIVLHNFAEAVLKIPVPNEGMKRIAKNVWQLPLEDALRILPQILAAAKASGLHLLAHVSDISPEWAEIKPVPATA